MQSDKKFGRLEGQPVTGGTHHLRLNGGEDDRPLYEGKGKRKDDQISKCIDRIVATRRFVRLGRNAVHLAEEPHLVEALRPLSVAEFTAAIPVISEVVDDKGFVIMTSKLARAVLHSDHFRRIPEVRGHTRHPIFGPNWQRPAPGVRPECLMYQATREVRPFRERRHLAQLLSEFHIDGRDGSFANLVALMVGLMSVIPLGPVPLGLFSATRPGEGKTLLARVLAILFGEPEPSTVRYKSDSVLEKDIGAAFMAGDHVVILDNVRVRGRIDSPLLECLVTDRHHAFRRLGTSQRVKLINVGAIIITANDVMLHEDLASRAVIVNFRSEIAPRDRVFGFDPEDYAREFREEILGELIGMIEDWKAAGMPEADVRFRNPRWARSVGGVLDVAGIEGFLINHGEEDRSVDPRRRALFEFGLRHGGTGMPVGRWLEIIEDDKLLPEEVGLLVENRSRKALESALGRLMSDATGMTEIIGDVSVTLTCDESGHARGKTYTFDVVQRGLPSTSAREFALRHEAAPSEAESSAS